MIDGDESSDSAHVRPVVTIQLDRVDLGASGQGVAGNGLTIKAL